MTSTFICGAVRHRLSSTNNLEVNMLRRNQLCIKPCIKIAGVRLPRMASPITQ